MPTIRRKLIDKYKARLRANAALWREWHTRGCLPQPEFLEHIIKEKIGNSCLHCMAQKEEHAEGKCLFQSTHYEAFGAEGRGKLFAALRATHGDCLCTFCSYNWW